MKLFWKNGVWQKKNSSRPAHEAISETVPNKTLINRLIYARPGRPKRLYVRYHMYPYSELCPLCKSAS